MLNLFSDKIAEMFLKVDQGHWRRSAQFNRPHMTWLSSGL